MPIVKQPSDEEIVQAVSTHDGHPWKVINTAPDDRNIVLRSSAIGGRYITTLGTLSLLDLVDWTAEMWMELTEAEAIALTSKLHIPRDVAMDA